MDDPRCERVASLSVLCMVALHEASGNHPLCVLEFPFCCTYKSVATMLPLFMTEFVERNLLMASFSAHTAALPRPIGNQRMDERLNRLGDRWPDDVVLVDTTPARN